jgi:predicted nucleic acid-binding OB-fold protein
MFKGTFSQIYTPKIYLSEDKNFCEYLRNDKAWIDKQLHYLSLYNNYDEKMVNDIYSQRKELDQMIYQLCVDKDEL